MPGREGELLTGCGNHKIPEGLGLNKLGGLAMSRWRRPRARMLPPSSPLARPPPTPILVHIIRRSRGLFFVHKLVEQSSSFYFFSELPLNSSLRGSSSWSVEGLFISYTLSFLPFSFLVVFLHFILIYRTD
jgi:hypothetical protein